MLPLRPNLSSHSIRSNLADNHARPFAKRCQRRYTAQVMAVASPSAALTQNTDAVIKLKEGTLAQRASLASPFLALGVDSMLVDALPSINVTRPSPIQAAALPAILTGANCAVQSYTGSGKTLSYLLPALTLALRRAEAVEARHASLGRSGGPDVPIQVLVVAPSQELAMQIMRVAKSLLPPDVRKFAVQQVIGGANPKRQVEALAAKPGPLLVVGTPGRLGEMVRTGSLKLHRCPLIILDEADQLLSPAFAEDVNHLVEHCGKRLGPHSSSTSSSTSSTSTSTPDNNGSVAGRQQQPDAGAGAELEPSRRQTVLVSATLTPSMMGRAARWCPDPRFVSAGAVPVLAPPEEEGHGQQGAEDKEKPAWGWGVRGWDGPASPLGPKTRGSAGGVEGEELIPTMPPQLQHFYLVCEPRHKVDTLRRVMHALAVQRALVFMNFQQRLQDTQFKLKARGMKAAALHGELPRLTRTNILNDFRRGRLRALVVSDVAARGIDVPECDAVFHLELPSSAAHYAHRAGRTGRLSAAIAAQAAAAATAAADAAVAGDTAADAAPAQSLAASIPDSGLMEDQAAGTVVTIVAPNERFVVDKIAQHLGVPLLEAHVSHGQLRMGPPPGGYSFEKDSASDREGKAAGDGKEADAETKSRKQTGAQASTSGRASKAAATAVPAAAAAAPSDNQVAGSAEGKKARRGDDEGGKYEVVVDEDDDIVLDDEDLDDEDDAYDYEVLDEDLEAFKRLRPSQVRQLAAAAAAGGGGTAATDVVQLKAQRKKRVVLPTGVEPGSSPSSSSEGGTAVKKADSRPAAAAWRGPGADGRSRNGKWQGGRRADAHDADEEEGKRPRPTPRKELMEQMRKELDEIRVEKDKERRTQQARGRW